jgi:hypothetical protein
METPSFKDPTLYEKSPRNFCILVMELLYYHKDPDSIMILLIALLKAQPDFSVIPHFLQKTIPNPDREEDNPIEPKVHPHAMVRQDPFGVYMEDFSEEWLDEEKVKSKLKEFDETNGKKIIFLLSKYEEKNYKEKFQKVKEVAQEEDIILEPVSYQDFLLALEEVGHSEIMKDIYRGTKKHFEKNGLI